MNALTFHDVARTLGGRRRYPRGKILDLLQEVEDERHVEAMRPENGHG